MASTIDYDGTVTAALGVTDLDVSVTWYRDVLGLELSFRDDDMAWCEFQTPTPGLTLGISVVEEIPRGGGATLTLGVKDVASARAQLEARDVRFDGETQTIPGMVSLATFFDPDGNQLMLAQVLAGEDSTA